MYTHRGLGSLKRILMQEVSAARGTQLQFALGILTEFPDF